MDTSIRIVRLLEQVFEPYRIMFKELKEKRSSSHHKAFAKKRKTRQNTKTLLGCRGEGGELLADFRFSWVVLEPNPGQKRWLSLHEVPVYMHGMLKRFPCNQQAL
jgi:hypothetical protein